MRLHFHQDMGGFRGVTVNARGIRIESRDFRAFHDRCVVRIGHHRAARMLCMSMAHHAEQRLVLFLAVDDPIGVEDLVPAVLRVCLREHHQFDIGGIAPHALEIVRQVVDLVLG